MKETSAALALATHALATLPDSVAARTRVLDAIVRVVPRGQAVRVSAQCLLEQLAEHDRTLRRVQSELPLTFTPGPR